MRATIAKKLNNLIPDNVIPSGLLHRPGFDIKKFKKKIWMGLNWIQRSKISNAYRREAAKKVEAAV